MGGTDHIAMHPLPQFPESSQRLWLRFIEHLPCAGTELHPHHVLPLFILISPSERAMFTLGETEAQREMTKGSHDKK